MTLAASKVIPCRCCGDSGQDGRVFLDGVRLPLTDLISRGGGQEQLNMGLLESPAAKLTAVSQEAPFSLGDPFWLLMHP